MVQIGAEFVPALRKAFGNFTYSYELSEYKQEYCLYSYKDSIEEIENSGEELLIERLM